MNKVYIVNIGNELLSGRTVNTNLTTLGKKLLLLGFEITEAYIIPDTKEAILNTLKNVWKNDSLIIFTGGLGPTKDDITKTALAEFFNKDLIFYEHIYNEIKERFLKRNLDMPEVNKVQAYIPRDFLVLQNTQGTAPGMFFKEGNRFLFSLPGVPFEMEHLFDVHLENILKDFRPESKFYTFDINTYGIGESKTSELLDHIVPENDVNIAWLPNMGRLDIRLSGRNLKGIKKVFYEIIKILKIYIWGINEKHPIDLLHRKLINKNLTISTAESCTGGMLSSLLTKTSGSSNYFLGSIVAYSNDVKINTLKIPIECIEKNGAVSEETVLGMIDGCKKMFNTNIVCAITGIAGPSGATIKNQVGTVYIGISINGIIHVEKCFFTGNRDQIRQRATEKAVFMILKKL